MSVKRTYKRPQTVENTRTIPPWVLAKARESREWARKAGPVVVVQAMRCECGEWMRPGLDHLCSSRPPEQQPAAHHPVRHAVTHFAGQPVECSCGWRSAEPVPTPLVELVARIHLTRKAAA